MDKTLRSIDDSIPKGRLLKPIELRSVLHDMCNTLGIEWTENLGDYLLTDVLEKWGFTMEGEISEDKLQQVVSEFKQRPRIQTRHPKKITIFGGGSFGTALAYVLGKKSHHIKILMRDVKEEIEAAESINKNHRNTLVFSDKILPDSVTATIDPVEALNGVELIVLSIPVQFTYSYLSKLKNVIPKDIPIVCTSKGIFKTAEFMNEIIPKALERQQPVIFMSGPSFAKGIMDGDPTSVTFASPDPSLSQRIQHIFSSPVFRAYTTTDIVSVEISGALKNVLAIGCGAAIGLNYGANTQATIVTRGWSDIRKIVLAKGGKPETLLGLSGIGDLMLTCFGGHSRNTRFGEYLAKGMTPDEACKAVGQTVEGLPTSRSTMLLANTLKVDVPVLRAISDMIEGKISARDMVIYIMTLPLGSEF